MKMAVIVLAILSLFSIEALAQEGREAASATEGNGGYGMVQEGGESDSMGPGMMNGGGYSMRGGMAGGGGYGMGHGLVGMRGHGMGPGYYVHSPECQEFYNHTVNLRKEFYDKKFEYFETLRDPKAIGETAARLYKELKKLHHEIYVKAPLGCNW